MHRVSVLAVFHIFFKSGSKFLEIIMLKLHSILLVKVKALTFEQCYVAETFHCDVSEMFSATYLRCYNAMSQSVDIWTYWEHSCDISRMLQCYVAETFHCDVSEMLQCNVSERWHLNALRTFLRRSGNESEHLRDVPTSQCDVPAMFQGLVCAVWVTNLIKTSLRWFC